MGLAGRGVPAGGVSVEVELLTSFRKFTLDRKVSGPGKRVLAWLGFSKLKARPRQNGAASLKASSCLGKLFWEGWHNWNLPHPTSKNLIEMISLEKPYEVRGAQGARGRALNVSSMVWGARGNVKLHVWAPLLIVFSKGRRGCIKCNLDVLGTWAR